MSKEKRGQPSPEPDAPDMDIETIAAAEPAAVTPGIPAPLPIPGFVRVMARAVAGKWGVPAWLTYLAAATGSSFGTATHGTHNWCGVVARGTESRDENGYAWYGRAPFAFDKFGEICRHANLDYSNPAAVIAALIDRCPAIADIDHSTYKEA